MNTPAPHNTLYRFRTMDNLLGKYQELEKQAIYFASPEELNDPMEGIGNIVWSGDKIVWTNFIKHYVYCLVVCYFLYTLTWRSDEFDANKIPIPDRWDLPPNPYINQLFNDIWHHFLNLPAILSIIQALDDIDCEIGYRGIEQLLFAIQSIFIKEHPELYFQHGIIPESEMQQRIERFLSAQEWADLIPGFLQDIADFDGGEMEWIIGSIRYSNRLNNLMNLLNSSAQPSEKVLLKNSLLMMEDFSKIYLTKVERLLWPDWYTACFMKKYQNSSVWSHYGDQHRGACLIFETEKIGSSDGLALHQATDNKVKKMAFYEISYQSKPSKIDFFRSIRRGRFKDIMKLWYTDEDGNQSECAPHISHGDDERAWKKRLTDTFYCGITMKTTDWAYEEEYRLILADMSGEYSIVESRTFTYDFKSLRGIIFGFKASDEDKLRIIEIIREKCKRCERTDFKFYQAYYFPMTGEIGKFEIPIDLS